MQKSKQFFPMIKSLVTGTCENIIPQSDAAKVVTNLLKLEPNRARIDQLYKNTRIETRHLAVDLLSDEIIAFSQQRGNIESRMNLFKKYAVPVAERVARQALEEASASEENITDSIRLIVFVSSTGFVAPGVDIELIEKLELRRDIARVNVSFMGCAAAMNGLRVACNHVLAHPTHKALVICLELSSVNAVFEEEIGDMIIHSIFGDGCAAMVIGAIEEEQAFGRGKIVIKDHFSYLVPETKDGIRLGIKDNGITCKLSRQLPDYIEAGVNPIIERFLASHQLRKENIDLWGIHPGGTRIIEKSQISLGLSDDQVAVSWEILRQYGNMLSTSILFVLQLMILRRNENYIADPDYVGLSNQHNEAQKSPEKQTALTGIAFSFSPGIGVEGILFQLG
jgi:alpha-pyrone synthase